MINWPASDQWKTLFPRLCGRQELSIASISSAHRPENHSLLFVGKMTDELLARLRSLSGCLVLLCEDQKEMCSPLEEAHGVIYSDDPRYCFAEVLSRFWDARSARGELRWQQRREIFLGDDVRIDPSAVVEPGVSIGGHCVIEGGACIMTGARLGPRVRVGQRSVVRENAVIGGYGFGFALAEGKPTIRLPHVGGVRIGRDVEIGALSTVCSGTIDATIIDDGVKIDDHVHISHNCHVEEGAIITACATLCGSVRIERNAWLGPNCAVLQKLSVGANSVVGIGAVVIESVPDDATVFGNPARSIGDVPRRR
jgi:UDP-3-O-[3-hydroxymyristoyl] glucosamine N-acyltransferase LpxD